MSNTKRLKRKFRVEELREDVVWVTLLEGEKRGLQFGLRYGEFRGEFSEGDEIIATVESLNERNTEWVIRTLRTDTDQNE